MDKKVVAVVGEKNTNAELAKCISRMYRLQKMRMRAIMIPSIVLKKLELKSADIAVFKNLKLGRYDWLIFTSKNAVQFFLKELRMRRMSLPLLPTIHIAAVGPETARSLQRAGIRVHLVPKEFSAKHIVQALGRDGRPSGGFKGKRILFPRSAIAPLEPVRALRARGAQVTTMYVYTTIPAVIPRALIRPIEKGEADYLIFTSPSGIAGLMKNVQSGDGKNAVRNIPVVCIGPLTATAAHRFKFKKIHTAKTHTAEGVSDLLRTLA